MSGRCDAQLTAVRADLEKAKALLTRASYRIVPEWADLKTEIDAFLNPPAAAKKPAGPDAPCPTCSLEAEDAALEKAAQLVDNGSPTGRLLAGRIRALKRGGK